VRLLWAGVGLLALAFGIAWFAPSSSYLLLPDEAKPLADLVEVEGERPNDEGGIYYVDIVVRKASLLEEQIGALRPEGADVVPEHAIVPPGSSFQERRQRNLAAMDLSQQIAAAVALRELGYEVDSEPQGARVVAVAGDAPAAGKLEASDVIVAVDGDEVRTPDDLRRLIARRDVGETVSLRVRSGERTRTVDVGTIASPDDADRPIVGIQVEQFAEIDVPIDVEIDLGNVGGPSAGLAFALDVVEELRGDVDGGYRVAATGELRLDGSVAPVGGVAQKTIGARRAQADVFLVPAGDNAATARANADGLRVIPVETFQQALRALTTLPARAS
jgi:PDZ domain-containing protein